MVYISVFLADLRYIYLCIFLADLRYIYLCIFWLICGIYSYFGADLWYIYIYIYILFIFFA